MCKNRFTEQELIEKIVLMRQADWMLQNVCSSIFQNYPKTGSIGKISLQSFYSLRPLLYGLEGELENLRDKHVCFKTESDGEVVIWNHSDGMDSGLKFPFPGGDSKQ